MTIIDTVRSWWRRQFPDFTLTANVEVKPRARYVETPACLGSSQKVEPLLHHDGAAPLGVCVICNETVQLRHGLLVRHGYKRRKLQ